MYESVQNSVNVGVVGYATFRRSAGLLPWQFPFVTRYWDARYGVTAPGGRASNWLDMKLGTDLAQASGAAQPILLPYAGVNYLWLPGVNGNYPSAPDSVPLSITGDIDVRLYMAADDWTPAAAPALFYKYNTGAGNASYGLYMNTNGTLGFFWSADGSAALDKVSTAAPIVSNFGALWIRATLDVDNGAAGNDVKFYTSIDGVIWTQLGATVTTAGTTSIFDSNTQLTIGMRGSGSNDPLAGKVYRAQIYAGLTGTDLRFDANFTTVPEGATSFTESSANAATVTINSTGAKPAQIVGSQQLLGDGNHWMQAAFTSNQPATLMALVKQVTSTQPDALFDGFNDLGMLAQQRTGNNLSGYAGNYVPNSTGIAFGLGDYGIFTFVNNGASSRIRKNLGTAATGNSGANNPGGLTLFSEGSAPQNVANAQVKFIAQCDTALSVAQEFQLIRAMAAQGGVSL